MTFPLLCGPLDELNSSQPLNGLFGGKTGEVGLVSLVGAINEEGGCMVQVRALMIVGEEGET